MKLLTYTTRNYLLYSLIIFVTISILIYFVLHRIVMEEIDERMESTRTILVNQIHNGIRIESLWPYWEVKITPEEDSHQSYSRDTLIVTPHENEIEKFRQLKFFEKIDGVNYLIVVRIEQMESHDLLLAIGVPIGLFIFIWMVILLILNRKLSKRIWKPFHENLDMVNKFSVSDPLSLQLKASNIDELENLREALIRLTEKGRIDFLNLKKFTENASHEMQTPLGIMNTQLECLINFHSLDPVLAAELEKIYQSVHRMAKLIKSLLLLSKIENRQFAITDRIDLSKELTQNLLSFTELIESKLITVNQNIHPGLIQNVNDGLFRILVNNLVGNAIIHNYSGGNMEIILDENHLIVSNSGHSFEGDPEKWFARFSKSDPSSSSAGLGLAIVKEICDLHGWQISYEIRDTQHNIKISF